MKSICILKSTVVSAKIKKKEYQLKKIASPEIDIACVKIFSLVNILTVYSFLLII